VNRIRTAIVGAGIGREHLAGYLALPERFDVRALCDLDMARAREVVGERPIATTDDLDALLADDTLDLIDVCLPPHLHAPLATRVLEAGKHVVCEKPLATSPAEADALLAVAARTGRRLCPVFQYRFGPAVSQLAALRAADLTGTAYAASLETHWDRRADYYAIDWRGTWAGENGGAVLGHAIHNHDLLTTILGPVASVSAFVATRVNAIEVEDCAAISFRMASGAVATSSITLGAATDTTRLRVSFERLTLESGTAPYAPADDTWTFTARDAVDQARVDAVVAAVGPIRSGFAGLLETLADALESGEDGAAVTAEDGRRSIELVAAIYASARAGRAVTLPLSPTLDIYRDWAPAT